MTRGARFAGSVIALWPRRARHRCRGTRRRRKLVLPGIVLTAALAAPSWLLWGVLPDYYLRWRQLSYVMERVTAAQYHELHGSALTVHPGFLVGPGHLFEQLAARGHSLEQIVNRPGIYRLAGGRMPGHPAGAEAVRWYELRIEDGAVQRIVSFPEGREVRELALGRQVLTRFLESVWEVRLVHDHVFPERLRQAVIAAEDGDFLTHPGIDVKGMVRAVLVNARNGAIRQGGSTITQQLVKTFTGRVERTYREKAFEAALALHLELTYSKAQIMAAYLNNVYMGHIGPYRLHGLAAASKYLLGTEVADLSAGECALLAGMIKSPNTLSPIRQPGRAVEQAARILRLMKERSFLDEAYRYLPPEGLDEAGGVLRERLMAMAWVNQELERELARNRLSFSAQGERAVIEISVDPLIQEAAAGLLARHLDELERDRRKPVALEGAVVVVGRRDGGVRALVGGRGYLASQFNRASMARRPIGSLVKPFVYLTAMQPDTPGGPVTPATRVADTPMQLQTSTGPWRPLNYDRKYLGTITLEQALVGSRNVPAVRIGQRATLGRVAELLEHTGVCDEIRRYPSLFLGACSSNGIRLAAAYTALAREGEYVAPQLIDRVTAAGSVLLASRPEPVRVFNRQDSRVMTSMLMKVLTSGTGRTARRYALGSEVAGKTGTSSDLRDSWFAGYTPELSVVVWVGNDDNQPIGLTGAEAALPIWGQLMQRFGKTCEAAFVRPQTETIGRAAVPPSSAESAPIRQNRSVRERSARKPQGPAGSPRVDGHRRAADRPLKHQTYRFFD